MQVSLLPNDQRRAALSAGLLASEHDGEVVAAARALCFLLKKGNLDPAGVRALMGTRAERKAANKAAWAAGDRSRWK